MEGDAPKTKMPAWKAVLFLGLAVLFDALKVFFNFLVILGPVVAGAIVNMYVGGGVLGSVAGWATTLGLGAVEVFTGAGIAIGFLGGILAVVVGLFGWLLFMLLFAFAGINLFHHGGRRFLQILLGVGVSIIPFINVIPSFSFNIWLAVKDVRKEDKKARDEWRSTQTSARERTRQQQLQRAALIQIQQANALEEGERLAEAI